MIFLGPGSLDQSSRSGPTRACDHEKLRVADAWDGRF